MSRKQALLVLILLACGARTAVAASCTVASTNISFGNFTGTAIRITGTVTVKCPAGTAYQVGLDAGTGSGATVTNRLMTGPGGATLGYQLFSDAGYTSNWGNTSGTGWVTGTGSGVNQQITVYAQLPTNEYAPTGNYTDATVNVSVTATGLTTASSHFNVKATIRAACNVSVTALNFGAYAKVLINATSTIAVTCTNTTPYNVGLNAGTAGGATVTTRSMTGPGGTSLGYKLFSNSGHTINWGDTVGSDTVAGTGTGIAQSLTVYGQMPAGENVAPGSYSDTITATITF